ncbi:MAG TPA: flavodoxin family protein [Spirochaetes bacterium]|nr:flavodoxin family protein [Spirochaetota bacterium]
MKILIVYTHPNPASFNHAILEAVESTLKGSGHDIRVKDLYQTGFKNVLDGGDFTQIMGGTIPDDIKKEHEDILWAEGLVFIYPVWWIDRPAQLKGWIDRTMLQGFAFDYSPEGMPTGLLKHQKAMVITTTGGPEEFYDQAQMKDMIRRPMCDGTLGFCGIQDVAYKAFFAVPHVTDDVRKGMLEEAKELTRTTFSG